MRSLRPRLFGFGGGDGGDGGAAEGGTVRDVEYRRLTVVDILHMHVFMSDNP